MNALPTSGSQVARPPTPARTAVSTGLALLAFAANSILCRFALRPGAIDAASFSTVRLISGAITLLALSRWTQGSFQRPAGSWVSALALVLYALPFSLAYNGLNAGTGALILFGCVQLTMMAGAIRGGERPRPWQWIGALSAMAGLLYLVLPGIAAPPPMSAALMALAGVAWGVYSLLGRGVANPLAQTTGAFVRAVPLAVALSVISASHVHVERSGMALAVTSGAIASGLGYVIWYSALRGLTATRAAVVQLTVPILAALGGALFLAEVLSARLVVAALLVLGGVCLAIVGGQVRAATAVNA